MNRFHHVFSCRHVVLPVIHVVDEAQSCRNTEISREAGTDGIFLIHHDLPYKPACLISICFLVVTGISKRLDLLDARLTERLIRTIRTPR
ncbi:MAG: hypothetical protein QGI34_12990 [Candidatus Latescibacteria bacterium]|jgi:hypothetical protein|nr:hypothetical protein [Candidatus Latescibacterota bacterium]